MISFVDNYAAFRSGALLATAFREAVTAGAESDHLRTECQALAETLRIIGYETEADQVIGASFRRNDLAQTVPLCLEGLPIPALQLVRSFFFTAGGNSFGFSESAADRALAVFPDSENHGTPVESLFLLPSDRVRTGQMKGKFPEKVTIYRVALGPQGRLGVETLGFTIFDDVLYLRQMEGGRCPWIGLVNGHQAVAAQKLTAMELLEAYRLIMEHVGKPLQRAYDIRDVETLHRKFGGDSRLQYDPESTAIGRILDEGRFALLFENGGTRVICGKTADGKIRWLNFWENYLYAYEPKIFDWKAQGWPYIVIDPAIVGRMIGRG